MRLTETLKKINTSLARVGDIPKDIFIFLAILLLGGAVFMLGRISAGDISRKDTLKITAPVNLGAGVELSGIQKISSSSTTDVVEVSSADKPGVDLKSSVSSKLKSGAYVGSKNGKVYYLPQCAGVKRIKDENKVWFKDKADAETKGYRAASNCKIM